jgi:hypothetical protein
MLHGVLLRVPRKRSKVSRTLLFSACLCSTLVVSACNDEGSYQQSDPYPSGPNTPTATGTLEFRWSIDGRQEAAACTEAGVVTFDAVIVDEGFVIGEVRAPCTDFETSAELYTDDFLARSTLIDERGSPALRRIVEDAFEIAEDKLTRLVIDFPTAAVPMDPEADAGAPPAPDAGPEPLPEPDAGEPPPEATGDAGTAGDAAAP